jgi:CBS domain containing-hemolysin-like protein
MNEVEFENVKFTVLKVDERRIDKIKVEITPLLESEDDDDDDDEDDD